MKGLYMPEERRSLIVDGLHSVFGRRRATVCARVKRCGTTLQPGNCGRGRWDGCRESESERARDARIESQMEKDGGERRV